MMVILSLLLVVLIVAVLVTVMGTGIAAFKYYRRNRAEGRTRRQILQPSALPAILRDADREAHQALARLSTALFKHRSSADSKLEP